MKPPANKHKQNADMNVVPYIDVMLVLLVIFMVTAPMLTQGVQIELPKVEAQALPSENEQKILTLSVKNDGSFYWNLGDELDIRGETGNAADVDAMVEDVSAIVAREAFSPSPSDFHHESRFCSSTAAREYRSILPAHKKIGSRSGTE